MSKPIKRKRSRHTRKGEQRPTIAHKAIAGSIAFVALASGVWP